MGKSSLEDTDYELLVLLIHTKDAIVKARDKALRAYNLSNRQSGALYAIQLLGPRATPVELSRFFSIEPHSVSELLTRMERRGLIRRVKDLERKNLVRIALTKKGLEAYNHAAQRDEVHRMMASLSNTQKQQLKTCLHVLRNAAVKELGLNPERFVTFDWVVSSGRDPV